MGMTPSFKQLVRSRASAQLIGRERELSFLEGLLGGVHERGQAVLLRGEAGIGKSSLLAAASESAHARGFQVLRASGVQWETHLPFACLHQLLRPILHRVEELPNPQRVAMQAAFGMTQAAAPDFFFIALAVLDLLADAAAQAPLLLIVEDLQWVDRPTRDIVLFVARRLESEPTILLAAARVASTYNESSLPELVIEPLDPAASEQLLDAGAPGLSPAIRRRILEDASGNPLALVELPLALPAESVEFAAALPFVLPLTSRLERAFAVRVGELPETARVALLAAATDDEAAMLSEILAVATVVLGTEVVADVLDPAVAARLIERDGLRIRFRHPLVRSAIHQAAGVSYRQTVHAAWAAILTHDPDRQVWHRASSLNQPDEEVASALERAAGRARHRGAIPLAITALERAVLLTPGVAQQGQRLISAAELAFEIGDQEAFYRLLAKCRGLDLPARERSKLACLQGIVDDGTPANVDGVRELLGLAEWAKTRGDLDLTLQLLHGAARNCWFGSPPADVRAAVVAAGERLDADPLDPRMLGILAIPDPIGHGGVVIDRLAGARMRQGNDTPDAWMMLSSAFCAYVVGDFVAAEATVSAAIPQLRQQGRLSLLAQALVVQASAGIYRGNWDVAWPAAEEARRLTADTDQPVWAAAAKLAEAMVAGVRGERDVRPELTAIRNWAVKPLLYDSILGEALAAAGVVALSEGRYEEGYEHLRRVLDPEDPAYHHAQRAWMIGFLAEAAVHSGRVDEGRAVLATVEGVAARTPSPMLHLGMGYARAVLAEDDQAEALFERALTDPILPQWPFPRARINLAYGVWLRRQRRVVQAREPLRVARDVFDSLGGKTWGERARQELRATGEASERRKPGAGDLLSPQEVHIAQLAAEGLSNREIGQQLYLSHRTVGSHLYRIFPKLGITSRSQLKFALGKTLTLR